MLIRFIIFIVLSVIGFYLVRKPLMFLDIVGRIDFAERTFSGGTPVFLKILGVALIFLGIAILTGVYVNMINFLLGFIPSA